MAKDQLETWVQLPALSKCHRLYSRRDHHVSVPQFAISWGICEEPRYYGNRGHVRCIILSGVRDQKLVLLQFSGYCIHFYQLPWEKLTIGMLHQRSMEELQLDRKHADPRTTKKLWPLSSNGGAYLSRSR